MSTDPQSTRFQWLGLAAAIVLPGIVLVAPAPQGLAPEGQRMAALFLAALVLWVTEPVPIAITSLLTLILQPLLRIAELPAAFTSFISPVFFFVLVMYFIAHAFTVTKLDRRFAYWLLDRAGVAPKRVVLAFMIGTGALSTVISDVPCAAIFMAIALGIFEKLGLEPGKSSFAKSIMIGIPIASLIGGVGTPAGSSINVLGLFLIEQHGKVRVSFLEWMIIGIPMVIVLVPLSAWVLCRFFPSEVESIGSAGEIREQRRALGAVSGGEKKVLAIMGTMVVLWIASTWFRQIDTVLVAVAGAAVMFMPGIRLFSWKDVQQATGWEGLLMIGSVTSLGAASAKTGLAKWLVDVTVGSAQGWSPVLLIAVISLFTALLHLVLPVNPAINAALVPPIAVLAQATGHNPALLALPVVFSASCAFLLPLDAVPLVTYGKGYYRMLDMFVPGLVLTLAWVVLLTILLTILGPVAGLR